MSLQIIFFIGAIIRRSRNGATRFRKSTDSNSYQGYAITAGRFMSSGRRGTALVIKLLDSQLYESLNLDYTLSTVLT